MPQCLSCHHSILSSTCENVSQSKARNNNNIILRFGLRCSRLSRDSSVPCKLEVPVLLPSSPLPLPRPEARDERIRLWPQRRSLHHHGQPGMLVMICALCHVRRRVMARPQRLLSGLEDIQSDMKELRANRKSSQMSPNFAATFRNLLTAALSLPSLRLNLRVASEVRWMNADLSRPPPLSAKDIRSYLFAVMTF